MEPTVTDPEKIHDLLDRHILANVEEPGQYVDGEVNALRKDPADVDVRVALCFPDRYPLGMSHVGYKILYAILNDLDWAAAERAYAPWPDMQEKMRQYGIPLYTLESYRPARGFDALAFTLQSELLFTNILMMLEMAGVPVEREGRGEEDPIVIAGGPGAGNPEPMADFIDLFFVGDGEETIVRFAELLRRRRQEGLSRRETILEAARSIEGAYAPAFYRPLYGEGGRLRGMERLREDLPERIRAARVHDLDAAPYPTAPVVPGVQAVHEQVTLEIMRGCTRGCRFCHAGMTTRPVRHRSPDTLMRLAKETYSNTGFNEIGLASLSSSDYPHMDELLERLTEHFDPLHVNISLPSLRVSEELKYLVGPLSNVRKSSLTLAPEAATERLRTVINKDITSEELLEGARAAEEAGWKRLKLYFMVGLPTENLQDIAAVGDLCREVLSHSGREGKRSRLKLNVTISPFVPKPHTPFQWEPMLRPAEIQERVDLIRTEGGHRKVRYKFHEPRRSVVEAALARGDRRMGRVIRRVWENGGQFDGWDDWFRYDLWEGALREEVGVEIDDAAARKDVPNSPFRRRDDEEVLPWDHIDCGVLKEFLHDERERARSGMRTKDCREDKCRRCGARRM
jgi:radical SAM family uncharacterized protein